MNSVAFRSVAALAGLLGVLSAPQAGAQEPDARLLCTLVLEVETDTELAREGEGCGEAVTPASTFKPVIALMGFEAGILKDAHTPALPFKEGYADWLPVWRQTTDPALWMAESTVWYSQRITEQLGAERVQAFLADFDYGNRDMAGRPGEDGLTRAWLSSTLAISPEEQARFYARLAAGELPVSQETARKTAELMRQEASPDGWTVYGKTGMGAPRPDPAGEADFGRAYGWFVGFAEKDGRRVAFARLIQDTTRRETPTSFRARDSLLEDLPALAE